MAHIDYYFSVLSPYTYLAGLRLEDIADKHNASVDYYPLDIMALFAATGGVPPGQRHVSRQQYRLQDLERQAEKSNLSLNLKPAHWPTNPLPASKVVIATHIKCKQEKQPTTKLGRLVHALTAACWRKERDIAEDNVIVECLQDADCDTDVLHSAQADEVEKAYQDNLQRAINAGVFGAPFYVVGEQRFWGQDRLDDLDHYLSKQS